MNTKELIKFAMQQQTSSDEMIDLLSVFKGLELECDSSKEMTWAKIYLLGVAIGTHKGTESVIDNLDFAFKVKRLNQDQRAILKTKMDEALDAQRIKRGNSKTIGEILDK